MLQRRLKSDQGAKLPGPLILTTGARALACRLTMRRFDSRSSVSVELRSEQNESHQSIVSVLLRPSPDKSRMQADPETVPYWLHMITTYWRTSVVTHRLIQ